MIKRHCVISPWSDHKYQAGIEPATLRRKSMVLSIELRWQWKFIKYLYNIPMQFWSFYYQWKRIKSKEHDQTRVPKPLPAEIKRWRLQGWFSNFEFSSILLVPKHGLLKYFTLTFTRHKSSKFEGSGPPLRSNLSKRSKQHWNRKTSSSQLLSSPNV